MKTPRQSHQIYNLPRRPFQDDSSKQVVSAGISGGNSRYSANPLGPTKTRRGSRQGANLFDELIVDNFAGAGGASMGIEAACGRSVDIAINHDRHSVMMHQLNHPHTRHLCEDVWHVDPKQATAGRPVGLAWFSPDCFPAGTLVLTRTGYRPIEDIELGDEVLTHNNRWRKVVELHRSFKSVRVIRGHGHPGILCTAEHPFLTKKRTTHYDSSQRRQYWSLGMEEWTEAEFLDSSHYWATPTKFPDAAIPEVGGRGLSSDARLMWLAGRYVGDGWTRLTDTRAELVIICGKHEANALGNRLEAMWPRSGERSGHDEMGWHDRELRTAFQFSTNHRGLVEWLRQHFGHGAHAKTIPGWLLGIPEDLRQSFLDGYMSADGHRCGSFWECGTVSKALAFGIKSLAVSLGKTVCVYIGAQSSGEIEGRAVNVRPIWRLRWRDEVAADHRQTRRDLEDGREWCPIRENIELDSVEPVFNIGVEEDESYVVEGIIVHNCRHFSRDKGGKPVKKNIRGLAWVVIRWAKLKKPRIIVLENVREFQDWGPLTDDNRPCPKRKGQTYKRWRTMLENLGYHVETRILNAAEFGAPTHRRRFFLIARCDGQPINWPEPTHGPGRRPYRTAAQCIDWTLPCPSIFLTKAEAKPLKIIRPLAEKTMRRIAMGLKRYVLENPKPFIVTCNHAGPEFRGQSIDEPFKTLTAARDAHGVVQPCYVHDDSDGVTQIGKGWISGALLEEFDEPMRTVMTDNRRSLVSAFLAKHYGGVVGHGPERPLGTITAVDHHSLVTSNLVHFSHGDKQWSGVDEPLRTITSGNHACEVRAFLVKYYGTNIGQPVNDPLHTITSRDRLGLVKVEGHDFQIVDIGLRMLTPRELLRAQFGKYAKNYILVGTKSQQVARIGNSVPPEMAEAIVRANFSQKAEVAA